MKVNKNCQIYSVMWIWIDCIRIHKIWSIRIQSGSRSIKSPNFQNNGIRSASEVWVEWGGGCQQISAPSFLRFRLEKYNFLRKKKILLVKLCFSLNFISSFIPLDPDPDSESGSGSTVPNESGSDQIRFRIHITGFMHAAYQTIRLESLIIKSVLKHRFSNFRETGGILAQNAKKKKHIENPFAAYRHFFFTFVSSQTTLVIQFLQNGFLLYLTIFKLSR